MIRGLDQIFPAALLKLILKKMRLWFSGTLEDKKKIDFPGVGLRKNGDESKNKQRGLSEESS